MEVTRAAIGDTALVTSQGAPPSPVGGVEVFWRSPELVEPVAMLVTDSRVVVADRRRLHLLTADGAYLRSVGRSGEGPGEYRYIAGLGLYGADSIAVHDALNYRISIVDGDGEFLTSWRATPPSSFVNPLEPSESGGSTRTMAVADDGILSLWRDGVFANAERPTRTALVWRDLIEDSVVVRRTWEGAEWIGESGFVTRATLYGPEVIVSLGRDGRLAVGDGLAYCIRVWPPAEGAVQQICRERADIPAGAGVLSPDLDLVRDPRRREAIRQLIARQETREVLPHFDRLLLAEDDKLWVRLLDPEWAEVSPFLLRDVPESEPARRLWEVFDTDGSLLRAIQLPSNFEPQVASAERVFGFLELPSGEIAIALVAIPQS